MMIEPCLWLAQLTPDAVQVAGWLASAFFIAGGLNQILKLTDRAKERPPPAETYVTKVEYQRQMQEEQARLIRLEVWMDQWRREIRADLTGLGEASEARAHDLHQRVNPLEGQIRAVDAKFEEQRQRLAHIDAKLDRLMERSL